MIEQIALVTLFTSVLAGGVALGSGIGFGGISDEDLWGRITTADGDVLFGMSFEQAVCQDPRRIDARIQQILLAVLYRPVQDVRGVSDKERERILREFYLSVMRTLRARGGDLTAGVLAELYEEALSYYETVLDKIRKSPLRKKELEFVFSSLEPEWVRGFSEAVEVAKRAQSVAPGAAEALAWQQIQASLARIAALLSPSSFPAYGLNPSPEWEQFLVSGHRAPHVGLPQYRRMGGRFY
jgi:hypothetical protein